MVGMMDQNEQKARFSLSYIEAVASQAGFQVVETRVDRDSVDGVLIADFGRRPRIEFQAKATARDVIGEVISAPTAGEELQRTCALRPLTPES